MSSHIVDLEGLQEMADVIMAQLGRGGVVWLSGDLGSGKTAFVRAAVSARQGEPATSPTYALVHEYNTPSGPIVHVDCYRLVEPHEAIDIDFPALQEIASVLFVEWPERAAQYAPVPDLRLRFSHVGNPDQRLIEQRP